jgi:hypothetical protein
VTRSVATWPESIANLTGRTVAEVDEAWSERAAVRQYLGGLERAEAEREARGDVERMWLR